MAMRITTCNVNGLRAAATKGFIAWMLAQKPDVACVQEIRAREVDLPPEVRAPKGYRGYFHSAEKRGYSGVGLYARREPDRLVAGLGMPEFDVEGRYLQADFGSLCVVSLYLPSGVKGPEAQARKYDFMERFLPKLEAMRRSGREFVICGDWNVAHREIDVKNWRKNMTTTGFLQPERDWLTRVFEEHGFVDVFRAVDPSPDRFTWWLTFGHARERNLGWRIDYQVATPGIAKRARRAAIFTETWFSDHAPVTIDYDYKIGV
jgi:exodeoxyribonuclease-3